MSIYKKIVGLTGIYGSGKTTVADIFRELGHQTVSADQLAHQALNLYSYELSKHFGIEILNKDSTVNRRKLGELVFTDSENKKKLEAIIHPKIRVMADQAFESLLKTSKGDLPIIYDCPLLFETGLEKLGFFKIITVTSNEEKIFERVTVRDKITLEQAILRYQSQIPLTDKIKKSDFVIENNSTLEDLKLKVIEVSKSIILS